MLKETETEKKYSFYDIFIIGSISIGGRPGPPSYLRPMVTAAGRFLAQNSDFNAIIITFPVFLKQYEQLNL